MISRLGACRLLAEPGAAPARRNAEPTIAEGRTAEIACSDGAPCDGQIALPDLINTHDRSTAAPGQQEEADDSMQVPHRDEAYGSRVVVQPLLDVRTGTTSSRRPGSAGH